MAQVLQLNNHIINAEEIISLLTRYQLIPQLLCESMIDQATATIECTAEEVAAAYREFDWQWGITSEDERQQWQSYYGLTAVQLDHLVTRTLRVEKFKQITWGHKLESYFLKRKTQLDQVIYSLLRVTDHDFANELHFRIREGEESFAELARHYSEGPEAATGGLLGPVELGSLSMQFAQLLSGLPVGEVQPPIPLGEWQIIVRVEKQMPAQLDAAMRQRLLQEQFETWFQQQIRQLPPLEQIWMGVRAEQKQTA